METGTAKAALSAFDQLQDNLANQARNFVTQYVFSPMQEEVLPRFPHKKIYAGLITSIKGDELPIHYSNGEMDESIIQASGGMIRRTANGKNWYSFARTKDVAAGFVQENAMHGAVLLNELEGIDQDVNLFNDLLFPEKSDRKRTAPFRSGSYDEALAHVLSVANNADEPIVQKVAEKIARAMEGAASIAQNITQLASARLATPGNTIPLDSRERQCFYYLGLPTPGFAGATVTQSVIQPTVSPDLLAEFAKVQAEMQRQNAEQMQAITSAFTAALDKMASKPELPKTEPLKPQQPQAQARNNNR